MRYAVPLPCRLRLTPETVTRCRSVRPHFRTFVHYAPLGAQPQLRENRLLACRRLIRCEYALFEAFC